MPNKSEATDNQCPYCEGSADLDAKYCKNCGKPISLSGAPFDLTKRFLATYPTYLVTLVSIIQGAALGYLLVAVDNQLSYVLAGEYDPIWTILLVGLFVLIVAIFVQYASVAVVWRLTPTTVNSLAPFCLGVIQAIAIFSIVRQQIAWVYFSMSLL